MAEPTSPVEQSPMDSVVKTWESDRWGLMELSKEYVDEKSIITLYFERNSDEDPLGKEFIEDSFIIEYNPSRGTFLGDIIYVVDGIVAASIMAKKKGPQVQEYILTALRTSKFEVSSDEFDVSQEG